MTTCDRTKALVYWNELDAESAAADILLCCGSSAWAQTLAAKRPYATPQELFDASDAVWAELAEADWREAFDSHPRIGQQHARSATAQSLSWSWIEQSAAMSQDDDAKLVLADANRQYEERFGRIFIVCASGKSATEILAILQRRMQNSTAQEMLEAAEQQRQITQLRLRKWLGVN
jgi:2-oxo-4-hydroxy-4-carboxy-5-ureidoimidazoline decarboxylase